MRNGLLLGQLPNLVEEKVELVLGLKVRHHHHHHHHHHHYYRHHHLEVLQALEAEALKRSVRDHPAQQLDISHKLLQPDGLKYLL